MNYIYGWFSQNLDVQEITHDFKKATYINKLPFKASKTRSLMSLIAKTREAMMYKVFTNHPYLDIYIFKGHF